MHGEAQEKNATKPIKFGKYSLLERISHGGMAEVFRAKTFGAAGFERTVAIKLLLPTVAMDREFITMLIDEAKIAGQLSHANIAQIFDLGMAEGRYYIVQEFVNGKDLRAILRHLSGRDARLTIAQSCHVLLKVCEGLEYAHNKRDPTGRALNLVHRDVSPQNIVVSREGEVKLIDFGIAKAEGRATRTLAGLVKGKFAYMSPEQIRGLPVDRRSDVFACGIVLWELLTGKPLFRRKSEFETLKRARSADIEPPSQYNPNIPPALDRVSLKALARHVEDRYQTAIALRDDLWEFVRSHGEFYSRNEVAAWMRDQFGKGSDDDEKKQEGRSTRQDYSVNIEMGEETSSGDDDDLEGHTIVDPDLAEKIRNGYPTYAAPRAASGLDGLSAFAHGPDPDRVEMAGDPVEEEDGDSPDLAMITSQPPQETAITAPSIGSAQMRSLRDPARTLGPRAFGSQPPGALARSSGAAGVLPSSSASDDETQPPLDQEDEPTNDTRGRSASSRASAARTASFERTTAAYLKRGDQLASPVEPAGVEPAASQSFTAEVTNPWQAASHGPALPSFSPSPLPAYAAPPAVGSPPPQPMPQPMQQRLGHPMSGPPSMPAGPPPGIAPMASPSPQPPFGMLQTTDKIDRSVLPSAASIARRREPSRLGRYLVAGAVFLLLLAGATSITLVVRGPAADAESSNGPAND